MKPRLYFDTSVFGGINDVEFQEDSINLFKMVKNSEIICVFSDLTERELENAPEIVKNHFLSIQSQHREIVSVTEDAYNLAKNYIAEKIVGKTGFDDCIHIATTTINKVDYAENTPLNTVPFPICKLINPDASVVLAWVSL